MSKRLTVADADMARIAAKQNREYADAIFPTDPDGAYAFAMQAHQQEREAAERMAVDQLPTIGVGGDFVPTVAASHAEGLVLSRTVTAVNTEAAFRRAQLSNAVGAYDLGADAAQAVKAKDPIEQMLVHQVAAFHKYALEFLGKAHVEGNTIEQCRLANTAARLANVSHDAILTLYKKRAEGRQTVVVQHVSVNQGAQAVIGTVQGRQAPAPGGKPKNG